MNIDWQITSIAAIVTNSGVTQYTDFNEAHLSHVKFLLTGTPCKMFTPNGEHLVVESVTDELEVKYVGYDTVVGVHAFNKTHTIVTATSREETVNRLSRTIQKRVTTELRTEVENLTKELDTVAESVRGLANCLGFDGETFTPNDVVNEALRVVKIYNLML